MATTLQFRDSYRVGVGAQAVVSAHKLVVVFTILLGVLLTFVAPGFALPRTTLRAKTAAENIIASLCAMIAVSSVARPIASVQPHEQENPELHADVLSLHSMLLC